MWQPSRLSTRPNGRSRWFIRRLYGGLAPRALHSLQGASFPIPECSISAACSARPKNSGPRCGSSTGCLGRIPRSISKWSPSYFVESFKTPTLVLHGELDYRVPVGQGMQLFTSLQMQKVPSKLLLFPDEGHWILKPQNSRSGIDVSRLDRRMDEETGGPVKLTTRRKVLAAAAAARDGCANSVQVYLCLSYNQAASRWNEALPVGNGHLGAMVFGGVAHVNASS